MTGTGRTRAAAVRAPLDAMPDDELRRFVNFLASARGDLEEFLEIRSVQAAREQRRAEDAREQERETGPADDMPDSALPRAANWLAETAAVIAADEEARAVRAADRQRAVSDRKGAG